jgi:hypothetical protein
MTLSEEEQKRLEDEAYQKMLDAMKKDLEKEPEE